MKSYLKLEISFSNWLLFLRSRAVEFVLYHDLDPFLSIFKIIQITYRWDRAAAKNGLQIRVHRSKKAPLPNSQFFHQKEIEKIQWS